MNCSLPSVIVSRLVFFAAPALMFAAETISLPEDKGPALLTYDEIRQLYDADQPAPELMSKLNALLTTPFVNNQASARGVKPLKPSVPSWGASLIVASGISSAVWNLMQSNLR